MGMSEFYGPIDEKESTTTIHRALELGVTLFDTADIYGFGDNERLVGKALHGKGSRVVIATKFGIKRKKEDPNYRGISGHPDYVKACCDASLGRLCVDAIDLFYIHRVDLETPIEETMGALADLVQQGKIRYVGLSNVTAQTVRRAHAVYPVSVVQNEYSLWSREPEDSLLPTVRDLGIGFVAYSPLGRGFLSGQIRSPEDLDSQDFRRSLPRFQGENFLRNSALAAKVRAVAASRDCTPSQLSIAWLLAQGDDVVPIPGTKRRTYLEANLVSQDVKLSSQELAEIDAACPKGAVAGLPYPDMSLIVR